MLYHVNEQVFVKFAGTINAAPSAPVVVLPYDASVKLAGIRAVVTTGTLPVVMGTGRTITIYGVDTAGNLYDISSVAWMTLPQVVKWSGGPAIPPNMNQAQIDAWVVQNIMSISDYPGITIVNGNVAHGNGLYFTENAPQIDVPPAQGIQVTCIVVMNNLLPDGSEQAWVFNDSVDTAAAGSSPVLPTTYDMTVVIPGITPNTLYLKGVLESAISLS